MARGLRGAHLLALFWTLCGLLLRDADGQEDVTGFSLSPPYFNLAQGSTISATATCGQDESGGPAHDVYCKLVGGSNSADPTNFQGQNCDYCDSGDPRKAHPVISAIDGTERWWQSPPLSRGSRYNEVNVTLDLGQIFHVAYVLIKFANSPRPDLWALERSVDHGRTYTAWQYFAHSERECIERFGKEPNGRVVGDDDQICTTDYSRIVPLENGEIVVSLINGRPGSKNFTYSPVLRDFTKATNIRLHFLRTNTLLGHLISKAQRDPSVTRRYYYSIKDISVGGRCVCHGHAQVCGTAGNADNANRLQCECQHNTCGDSCDRCCPGFNQQPWRAATVDNPNECQPCQCFSHASDCRYDPEVEGRAASLDTLGRLRGGGVCIHCQHNTAGVNCEKCQEGFFRPHGVPPESLTGCTQCTCDERTTAGCEMGSGRCICKKQFDGENCERCADGYYSYPECTAYPVQQRTTTPAGLDCPPGYFGSSSSCQPCPCDSRGTEDQVCDPSGRCLCRPEVEGQGCERCRQGHHSFPLCQAYPVNPRTTTPTGTVCPPGYFGSSTCEPCPCDSRGTEDQVCDPSGRCLCRPEVEGQGCERCRQGHHSFPTCQAYPVNPRTTTPAGRVCPPGYFGSSTCEPCPCDSRGTENQVCDPSGHCLCRPEVEGQGCERCRQGHHSFPLCQAYPVNPRTTTPAGPFCPPGYFGSSTCEPCPCDSRGTEDQVCDPSGRCLCRPEVEGQGCERCRQGHHSFPTCQACTCDGAGVVDDVCSDNGQCICFPNFQGPDCDQCASGHYGYPECAACQCDSEGTYGSTCNPLSGQCLCLPGVVGQECDRCASGLQFPQCSAPVTRCNPAGTDSSDAQMDSCRCLSNTEGTQCDKCKPLYWNLAPENPRGCTECRCETKGTLSGVGECDQKTGQCRCKPYICGQSCDSCSDGYYLLQKKNYFGCQGCNCDVGGVFKSSCEALSGQCWCRKNIVGLKCTEPAPGFYFPTLHQFKYEVEDGTAPNSRPVRFGYDPQEFQDFSWKGYAVLSPAQSEVRVSVHVDPKEGTDRLFRVVLRFTNPSGTSVTANVNVTNNRGGSEQSKEVVFPESPSPSFLTVPGEGFTEPFALTPGKWLIHIKAQGILLDYLVLLPREYYEAPLLHEKITEPCTYLLKADQNINCLLYKHVAMEGFGSALGSEGRLKERPKGSKRRQARVRRLTHDHPEMAAISAKESLRVSVRVPHSGAYVLVLEYASEVDDVQSVNIVAVDQSSQTRADIYSCAYSFLCRSVAVDSTSRVAFVQLSHKTELLLQTSTASFFLYKVYAVPAEEFSIEYVKPKPLCVSIHGRFTEHSQHCVLSRFNKPSAASVLSAAHDGVIASTPAAAPQIGENESWRQKRQSGPFTGFEPKRDEILLKFPQTEISFTAKVPLPGRYVVVVHYRQPEHISFPVEVLVDAEDELKGSINASFCPSVSGCRGVVVADGRVALDLDPQTWGPPHLTVTVPPTKTLILDYILVIPESSYKPDLLKANPSDKSEAFKQQCSREGFYTDDTSSQFCKEAARSLSAAYNDGALPCDCDSSGSTGSSCDPYGGQCVCRENVIGRRCCKCATGYFGFPHCRPCSCGTRLCDEVTGRCICPPKTVKPSCDVCQNKTFSFHPLLGCDGCNCSGDGSEAGLDCDRITGQCSCKPRVIGRQCDRCAPGFYRFPECIPCSCNLSGVGPDVCHPDTGRCLCKKNVAGKRCGVCRGGSFFFDPSNYHGCSRCFCFGATNRCQSSLKRRGKFVDMRGWRLESPDEQEVPSVLNTISNNVVADVQELPPTIQALYWVAPSSYLGERISSYGGFLTYQLKSFGIPSEGMTLIDSSADVLMTGHEMTLIHTSPQVQQPDRLYQGRVPLVEGSWRQADTNEPVSREEFLKVLAGLEGLHVRALHFTQTQRLSLGEVGLEEATEAGTGGPASNLESCSCPPGYSGSSCQVSDQVALSLKETIVIFL